MRQPQTLILALLAAVLLLADCGTRATAGDNGGRCDADIKVPDGFCATVFADNVGAARHLAVAANGDVYAALRKKHDGGGIVALRDADDDGRAEQRRYFGVVAGSGLVIHDGFLYFGATTRILRYRLDAGALVPEHPPETVVSGLPSQREHNARSLAIDTDNNLFVNIGAPSNACQVHDRSVGSPGRDPCPLLRGHGGIWRFDAGETGQHYSEDDRYASGIRNAVALAVNAGINSLYAVQHGRDQLHQNWPDVFTQQQGATLPAEEFFKIERGDDFGWPYCYYDPQRKQKLLAPEYGGDGSKTGRCGQFEDPILAFPAHWAPDGLLFYRGKAFGTHYRGGAFVAFHGSWNRAPSPQQGYKLVFVPFAGGKPADHWRDFATGFAGRKPLRSPANAAHRPVGLAEGSDGALYVSDDQGGRIYRITRKTAATAN